MTRTEISLLDILSIIKKRWIWILIAAIVCGAAGKLFTEYRIRNMTYEYTATVTMYMYSDVNITDEEEVSTTSSSRTEAQDLIYTYIELLKSRSVLEPIIEELGLSYTAAEISEMMSAELVEDTEVFNLSVTCDDPEIAIVLVNAIANEAPEYISEITGAGYPKVVDSANSVVVSYEASDQTVIWAAAGAVATFAFFLIWFVFDIKIWTEEDLTKFFDIPIIGDIPKLVEIQKPVNTENGSGKKAAI